MKPDGTYSVDEILCIIQNSLNQFETDELISRIYAGNRETLLGRTGLPKVELL